MLCKSFETGYTMKPNEMGKMGEEYAAALFSELGFIILDKLPMNGDVRLLCPASGRIHRLEVKTAQLRPDNKYVFHILDGRKKDYRRSDFMLLICVHKLGGLTHYLVPCASVREQNTITIPHSTRGKPYSGVWSSYLLVSPLSLTME